MTHEEIASKAKKKTNSLCASLAIVGPFAASHKVTLAVIGILLLISQCARLFVPFSIKFFMDNIVLKHNIDKLPWLIVAILFVAVIDVLTTYIASRMLTRAAETLIADLRRRVQSHIAHLPIRFYDNNLTGTLVSRIMSDVEGVRNLIGTGMMQVFTSAVMALIAFLFLIQKSWGITLAIGCIQLLIGYALHVALKFQRPIEREGSQIRAEVTGRLAESIRGVQVIKCYRAEEREANVFAFGTLRIFLNAIRASIVTSAMSSIGAMAWALTSALIMYFGAHLLLRDHWTVGDYLQYTAFSGYVLYLVYALAGAGTQLTQAFAGLERIHEIMAEELEDAGSSRIIALPNITGKIQVEGVGFAYQPGHPVLHDLSFEAGPGSMTALVGVSGAGKSTIISLLGTFRKPTSGRILVDGVDLSTVTLQSYRTQLGVVMQDCFLFEGTIRDNILFSRPDASEESLRRACRIACVDEFAERLPQAYETIVGERGVRLSGGQRQRMSIARAILADPRILIFDETTSSLDSESESMIQEGLHSLMQSRTTFVIAHRLSTIRRADQILVIEAGRILERGTHESLYQSRGRYHDLYLRQHSIKANLFLTPLEG